MLGALSSHVNGVALRVEPELVTLFFALERVTPSVEEDLDDIVADLESLLSPTNPTISVVIHVGPAYSGSGWVGRTPGHRLVYLAKYVEGTQPGTAVRAADEPG